jgi:hypothetical protein
MLIMSFVKISWNMNNVCNSKKNSGNFPIIRGIREHIDYQKCPPERYQHRTGGEHANHYTTDAVRRRV